MERVLLCQIMLYQLEQIVIPGKLIRLLEATMNGVQCKVRASNLMSVSFESQRGLRQGDGLSCQLFDIALEGLIRGVGLDHDIRGTILYRSLQFLGLVDDIDIIGRTTSKVREAYTRLKRAAARIALRINATKTKYLLAGDSDHLGSNVLIDGDSLEVVKEFWYLGTVVTLDNDISSEIRRRIWQGNLAYFTDC